MDHDSFPFKSLIYNGVDNLRDGIGNHLALLDRNIFQDIAADHKSLSPIRTLESPYAYGAVTRDLHLSFPDRFSRCLFLDVARDTWDSELIRRQMEKTLQHKRTFGAVTAIYLMWESDALWDDYADMVAAYDFCIVTSTVLDEYLSDRGVDFVHLPHPYDFPGIRPLNEEAERPGPINFGISAGFWPRKNLGLLAHSFAGVFGNDHDVRLTLHTRFDEQSTEFQEQWDTLRRLAEKHKNIELLPRSFSPDEYLLWLQSLDIYCFVSSGEGYSVTPREALHLGVPVLLHDAHVHSEFSHLPGVIKVPAAGMQRAIPNAGDRSVDIGRDWRIDEEALCEALVHCRTSYREIRSDLLAEYGLVTDLHDLDRARQAWVTTLREKYNQYLDKVVLHYPGFSEHSLIHASESIEHINMCSPGFVSDTGFFDDCRVLCLKSTHEPGQCLRGPGLRILESMEFIADFTVQIFTPILDGSPLSIEIHDVYENRRLLEWRVPATAISAVENQLALHVDARVEQVIEFRVYWHGDTDMCISGLRLERIV